MDTPAECVDCLERPVAKGLCRRHYDLARAVPAPPKKPAAVRGYGSGSIRERRPGVWELRAAGRSKTFRGGRKDAERELAKLTVGSARKVATVLTLGQLIDKHLDTIALERETRRTYGYALAHLPAKARAWKTNRLTLADFDQLYADLTRKGVSAHQVRKLHTVLSGALTNGVRWKLLDYNPARGAHLPEVAPTDPPDPDVEVLEKILAQSRSVTRRGGHVIEDLMTGAWIRLALSTGARRGEVCALRWSDIDLKKGTVRVAASLEEDRARKTTKTRKNRTVHLDPETVDQLKAWRASQRNRGLAAGAGMVRDPHVLSNALDGSIPLRPDGVTQRFNRLCARAGVEGKVTLNHLRHAHASLLISDGEDIPVVAARLGNRPETTAKVYAHVLKGADQAAAATIGHRLDTLTH